MREFTAQRWYELRGNPVAECYLDRESPRDGLRDALISEGFTIDGQSYELLGIESFALSVLRKGSPIALMVKRLPPTMSDDLK